jgi:hypothetical protein
MRLDKVLSKDEAVAVSTSWVHEEEHMTWRDSMATSVREETAPVRRKG